MAGDAELEYSILCWMARRVGYLTEDVEAVKTHLSQMEEYVVEAALHDVEVALQMLPDGSEGNPFAR
jgi:hypothetical protein